MKHLRQKSVSILTLGTAACGKVFFKCLIKRAKLWTNTVLLNKAQQESLDRSVSIVTIMCLTKTWINRLNTEKDFATRTSTATLGRR